MPPLLGGPVIQHYHQAIAMVVAETFEQARAAARLIRVDYQRAKGASISPLKNAPEHRHNGAPARPAPIEPRRRFRGRLRRGGGQARRELHDARSKPRDDGAARHDRGMGRRPADLWTSNQMIAWAVRDLAATLGSRQGERSDRLALYRRRLRSEAVHPGYAATPCWRRSAPKRRGPPGQGRARPPAHVQQHHAPAGDDPAHPHRCHARRQDHRDRHESWSGNLPAASPEGAVPRRAALCRRQPDDGDAPRFRSTCPKAMRCARRARRPA
jgi:xanthine dehydrogenase YagR molybdenum-binding subunit